MQNFKTKFIFKNYNGIFFVQNDFKLTSVRNNEVHNFHHVHDNRYRSQLLILSSDQLISRSLSAIFSLLKELNLNRRNVSVSQLVQHLVKKINKNIRTFKNFSHWFIHDLPMEISGYFRINFGNNGLINPIRYNNSSSFAKKEFDEICWPNFWLESTASCEVPTEWFHPLL